MWGGISNTRVLLYADVTSRFSVNRGADYEQGNKPINKVQNKRY